MKKENLALKTLRYLCLTCVIVFGSISIVGTGGGGGGDNGSGVLGVYYCTSQKDYQNSSYELQKTCLHIDRQSIRQTNSGTFVLAVAYADFDNDGDEDVFLASGDGSQNPTPVEMYLSDGSSLFALDLTIFSGGIPEAIHPRKALVGDFNGDSLPDIFIIAHGYDQPPFPGEHPLLILSSPNGLQNISGLETYVGFQHGGATADIDADQDLDIFVTDMAQPFFLINDGLGNFTYDTQRLPDDFDDNMYTAELIDIDSDGFYDLLVAGHEHDDMQTTIYWGSNTYAYTSSDKTILPAVIGQGTVLDIDADDIDNDGDKDIIVTRTGGGQGNSYIGFFIQIITSGGNRQFTDDTNQRILNGTGDDWIDWIRLQDYNNDGYIDIIVDDASRELIWLNNGVGVFQ
ncbi:MAG: VCBS repeat-containing protein [Deltaproteobacteria bacterium]|nr:VCBS repeat-containing protein [Deltaproteobacteria bacterium]